jgi:SAM-dependent methyltransferase
MENMAMNAISNSTVSSTDFDIEVNLKCPRCRTDMSGLACAVCGFEMICSGGIIRALPSERVAHYAKFIQEYEGIRAAEGRGSESDDFYLRLPYKDMSKRNSKQWRIRARSFDYLMKHLLPGSSADSGAQILDIGAGNCWMSFRMALAGYRPVALDLLTNDRDGLGAATHFQRYLPVLFPRFQGELSRLPFQDEQFDAIIFNASFHYSEDYAITLREALRCVKSGGLVIISDTPWYSSEESGRQMISERHAAFLRRYGTSSNSIASLEFLTDVRLRLLEEQLAIRWTTYSPWYGIKWEMRPLISKLSRKREPSRFRIFATWRDF